MKYGCNKQKFSHFEDTPLPKQNNNKQQPIFNERTFISRRLIKLLLFILQNYRKQGSIVFSCWYFCFSRDQIYRWAGINRKTNRKGPERVKRSLLYSKWPEWGNPRSNQSTPTSKRWGLCLLYIIERQKLEFDINSLRAKLFCLDYVHHKEKFSLLSSVIWMIESFNLCHLLIEYFFHVEFDFFCVWLGVRNVTSLTYRDSYVINWTGVIVSRGV